MRALFNVTFEIITPESAEHGDADSRGFISQGVTLRDAVADLFDTRTYELSDYHSGVEANEWPMTAPRWVTVFNGVEHLTGAQENRSIHFPENMTPSRRRHLARLLGA